MTPTPFAVHGAEKMIYDPRMSPVAIAHRHQIVIVYQANESDLPGHPHIISYDRTTQKWSTPQPLGTAAGLDHHFAPILWLDHAHHFHVLFNCHFSPGTHLVSTRPNDTTDFSPAPPIDASITYPWLDRLPTGQTILVYRIEGHLGYWVYRLSDDGGNTWSPPRQLLDFNQDPQNEVDQWAGEYLLPTVGQRGLHLGFCRWDERKDAHPRYHFKRNLLARYNVYYVHLDPPTGTLTTIDGQTLPAPVNRRQARAAKLLDTGDELTNFPTLAHDEHDRPALLAPITQDDPWHCNFHFFRWTGTTWQTSVITPTDNIWNASRFIELNANNVTIDLIVGHGKREETFYGGGELERWQSRDAGHTWQKIATLTPHPNLLYNNPRPIHLPTGGTLPNAFIMYAWTGPGGVWSVPEYQTENRNRGQAFLHLNGHWA